MPDISDTRVEKSPPSEETVCKTPLALRQLQTYNQPGLKETEIPYLDKRVTRSSKF